MKRDFVGERGWDQVDPLDRAQFFHPDGRLYWREDVCYTLTEAEVSRLHDAATNMVACVNAAVARAFEAENGLGLLALPHALQREAERSHARGDPSLYGRFDFIIDKSGTPKLLEFNADTPTALFEAAIMQFRWLTARWPEADQYNRIHEKLVARFRELGAAIPEGGAMHFACMREERDDRLTTDYLRDCAIQAGLRTEALSIADIGFRGQQMLDLHEHPITHLFKLYPSEWMDNEPFGDHLLRADIGLIEPPWRLAASSKMLLAELWLMFPDHENLLPATRFLMPAHQKDYLAKTAFGREGEGVRPASSPPQGPFVYQLRAEPSAFDGYHPVFGVWVVGDEPCGLGIREDTAAITSHNAHFVPHRIQG